jgi:hypothetical protein
MTWQRIRWIFPVIFAAIIIYQVFGHGPRGTPRPAADEFSDDWGENPSAVLNSDGVGDIPDGDSDRSDEHPQ